MTLRRDPGLTALRRPLGLPYDDFARRAERESRAELDEPLPFSHDADSLAAGRIWKHTTRYGDLDISLVPTGTDGYPDLSRDAAEVVIDGVAIRVASLADIIRSKQAANRPKHQRVLPTLREILASRYRNDSR
jgi:hypothetical protein